MEGAKTFYIESLGCITNRTDAARIESFFKSNGFLQTESYRTADIIVLMTCAFSQTSEDHNINRLNEIKREKKLESRLIVGGC